MSSPAADSWLAPALARQLAHDPSAPWPAEALLRVLSHLSTEGVQCLADLPSRTLLNAFTSVVGTFGDRRSSQRKRLDPRLCEASQLSPSCLDASLRALLKGYSTSEIGRVIGRATLPERRDPVLLILASNIPGLALQPLLASLSLRRPLMIKCSSEETFFTSSFVRALSNRAPTLGSGIAVVHWRGGDRDVEACLLDRFDTILAYGREDSLSDLEQRFRGRLVPFGPKASLAVVADPPEESLAPLCRRLAADIALFDQRGCLSLQAIYTDGNAHSLARHLRDALVEAAATWPPGPLDPDQAAAVHQLRLEADLMGHLRPAMPLASGTVIVDDRPGFVPSPGLRTVTVHPLPALARLPEILAPMAGRLQGAALVGRSARELSHQLRALGISYLAEPGELQSPGASWENDGRNILELLALTA